MDEGLFELVENIFWVTMFIALGGTAALLFLLIFDRADRADERAVERDWTDFEEGAGQKRGRRAREQIEPPGEVEIASSLLRLGRTRNGIFFPVVL